MDYFKDIDIMFVKFMKTLIDVFGKKKGKNSGKLSRWSN